jgi:hypothetical protein
MIEGDLDIPAGGIITEYDSYCWPFCNSSKLFRGWSLAFHIRLFFSLVGLVWFSSSGFSIQMNKASRKK